MTETDTARYDLVLVGAGIMSATLAALVTELDPRLRVRVVERLPAVAQESSNPWNNAGTGHSALCELNYTPRQADGGISTVKALAISEQFQRSREFWSSLIQRHRPGMDPSGFIHSVPHMSFVLDDDGFLARRHQALSQHPLFSPMQYSQDHARIAEWAPLLMDGRDPHARVAATFAHMGTDVDFGALTRQLFGVAQARGVEVSLGMTVTGLRRQHDHWEVEFGSTGGGRAQAVLADRVFVGAGGGALRLLQKSGIPEARDYGGFPISGHFLRADAPAITSRHGVKVYGQAAIGAPPMSVPHLDARVIDGTRHLMFGPYAGFSPKFLKTGSWLDLPSSVKPYNVLPMLGVAKDNVPLEKYLVSELFRSSASQFEALQRFYPSADPTQWTKIVAGQRVQVIKRRGRTGVLQFGTEVVSSADGRIAGLLGASPGASTAVAIMLKVIRLCFADRLDAWQTELARLIPSSQASLADDPDAARRSLEWTTGVLGLSR